PVGWGWPRAPPGRRGSGAAGGGCRGRAWGTYRGEPVCPGHQGRPLCARGGFGDRRSATAYGLPTTKGSPDEVDAEHGRVFVKDCSVRHTLESIGPRPGALRPLAAIRSLRRNFTAGHIESPVGGSHDA